MGKDIHELYPSNSMKNRDKRDKSIQRVVSKPVVVKPKGILDQFATTFFGEDASSVVQYIMWDVLIPAAKNTLSDMVSSGIEMLLFGDAKTGYSSSRRRDSTSRPTYVSYNSISDRRLSDRREPSTRTNRHRSYEDVLIEDRREAQDVLNAMLGAIEEYGSVSVADLDEMLDIEPTFTDDRFGWMDLDEARLGRTRDGYILLLPRPEELD